MKILCRIDNTIINSKKKIVIFRIHFFINSNCIIHCITMNIIIKLNIILTKILLKNLFSIVNYQIS